MVRKRRLRKTRLLRSQEELKTEAPKQAESPSDQVVVEAVEPVEAPEEKSLLEKILPSKE